MRSNSRLRTAAVALLAIVAGGGANGARGDANNTGGHWAGGSDFGSGLGQRWVPAGNSSGAGFLGYYGGGYYSGENNTGGYGAGSGGFGLGLSQPWVPAGNGCFGGFGGYGAGYNGGFGGGYYGGGGVYYPDPRFGYGHGLEYAEGRPRAYNAASGYPPAFYPAPSVAPETVTAPPAADPHIIYLGAETDAARPKRETQDAPIKEERRANNPR